MTQPDEPLDANFSLDYVFGECLICHRPSGTELLCQDCAPKPEPAKQNFNFRFLKELAVGSYGYIANDQIFYADNRYWVFLDALLVSWPEDGMTVKVRRGNTGSFIVDVNTLHLGKLGNLGFLDGRPYTPVILDHFAFQETPVPPTEGKVVEMEEGDSAYIDPLGVVLFEDKLFISGQAPTSKTPGDHRTLKITRRHWQFEIDHSTIAMYDEFSVVKTNNNLILFPAQIV